MPAYYGLIVIKTKEPNVFNHLPSVMIGENKYVVLYSDEEWPNQEPTARFIKRKLVQTQFAPGWLTYCQLWEGQDISTLIGASERYGTGWFRKQKDHVINFLQEVNTDE